MTCTYDKPKCRGATRASQGGVPESSIQRHRSERATAAMQFVGQYVQRLLSSLQKVDDLVDSQRCQYKTGAEHDDHGTQDIYE